MRRFSISSIIVIVIGAKGGAVRKSLQNVKICTFADCGFLGCASDERLSWRIST
jgi:hypothetical protein